MYNQRRIKAIYLLIDKYDALRSIIKCTLYKLCFGPRLKLGKKVRFRNHFYLRVLDNRIFHQANQGVSMARNAGLSRVRGKYIAWVDPDDWITPDWYEKQRPYLLDDVDMV